MTGGRAAWNVVTSLNDGEALNMRIARLSDVINRLKPLGIDTVGNSSEEFAKILADDIARWGAVAKAANIKMQQ